MEMLMRCCSCRDEGVVTKRCRGADKEQRRCRAGAEQVLSRCSCRGAEVQSDHVEVLRCLVGEEVVQR
jgi:hypothetical protein